MNRTDRQAWVVFAVILIALAIDFGLGLLGR